jgi:hypothetical protein
MGSLRDGTDCERRSLEMEASALENGSQGPLAMRQDIAARRLDSLSSKVLRMPLL